MVYRLHGRSKKYAITETRAYAAGNDMRGHEVFTGEQHGVRNNSSEAG